MLKSREELETALRKASENIVFNEEVCEKIRDYVYEKYNISTGSTMDMIAQRVSLKEKTEFELFCLADGFDEITKSKNKKIFFTEIEISNYTKQKLEINKIKFPIRIKCEQVARDQWIGASFSQFFMNLRRVQLIKYNANAQRVMKRVIRGESIMFKIIHNKLAIRSIKKLMKNNQYIPTSITLNIPYDSEADFYYDEKERELVIKNIEAFDISDGYHRYLAMCELTDEDPEFNYPMEIRIINFADEKSRQFIFQEDQKTKMAHSDSKTMNINRPSNIVIDRLNEMTTFDMKGQIGRNEGTISYAGLSEVIEYFYFKTNKNYTNVDIRNTAQDVKEKLNTLVEYNESYLNRPLGLNELTLIFYVFQIEENTVKACELIDANLDNAKKIHFTVIGKKALDLIKQLVYN